MTAFDYIWVLALIPWAFERWTKQQAVWRDSKVTPTMGFVGITVLRVIPLIAVYWNASTARMPDESAMLTVQVTAGLMVWGVWLASIIRTASRESNGWLAKLLTLYLAISVYRNWDDVKHAFRAGLAGKPLAEAVGRRE